ncbi:MAG: heme-copper oxidase subunit III [Proteobacteria bacterium]|nr:heme-copper oxidase subunit III [Pseudomonadota bacterium]
MTTAEISLPARQASILPNGVLAMILFVGTEVMFFTSLISAYLIIRSSYTYWPPAGQPRFSSPLTMVNTGVLLLSGLILLWAWKSYNKKNGKPEATRLIGYATFFGAFFLILQGSEWLRLIEYGLTIQSNAYGGLFYMIVGAHGLHVLSAWGVLFSLYLGLRANAKNPATREKFQVVSIFWMMVVLIWPPLYFFVYLF